LFLTNSGHQRLHKLICNNGAAVGGAPANSVVNIAIVSAAQYHHRPHRHIMADQLNAAAAAANNNDDDSGNSNSTGNNHLLMAKRPSPAACGEIGLIEEMQAVFDRMNHTENFSRVGANMKVMSAVREPRSKLVVEFVLADEHLNNKGTMHGGLTATLTDMVTARAVGMSVRDVPMVSVGLSVSYLGAARRGETVTVEAVCLRIGRGLAFTEASFYRKSDGEFLAKGEHKLKLLNNQRLPNGADEQF